VTKIGTSPAMPAEVRTRGYRIHMLYVGAIAVGAALIISAAINQPFNQNELAQIAPYSSDSLAEITGGTRQPPLDPLLGAMFQHLLGEGQLQQRLVPVLSGMGTLIVVSLLLLRLGLGAAGAFGVWVLATAPLMVRYGAYTRPYALPLFLMVVFVYSAQRWLYEHKRGSLVLVGVAAVLLPLARVPEPTVFLVATAATLAWLGLRGRLPLIQAAPLTAIGLGAVVLVGYPMSRKLATDTNTFVDLSLPGIITRFDASLHEFATKFLPLLAAWLPWWPITLLVIVATLAVRDSRRQLMRWWFLWPLLAAPVLFSLAYHLLVTEELAYRSRAAHFFVVPYVLMIVALASAVVGATARSRRVRAGLAALLCAALFAQLPGTVGAIIRNGAPDFDKAGEVIAASVPADGVVLYDRPARPNQARLGFLAQSRYLEDTRSVLVVEEVARHPRRLLSGAPIYLLINGQCIKEDRCDLSSSRWDEPLTALPSARWDEPIPGWRIHSRFDRFTLYAPVTGLSGHEAASELLASVGDELGPELGFVETFAAAALLELQGRPQEGRRLIREMYARASPAVEERIRAEAEQTNLNAFSR
jgi:hypothetical protein